MFWFRSEQPFIYSKNEEDMEFMTLYIKGQSFMMHHIRKMIG
jgi:tRNA U38,U39,U40 pseudouridine synthase TruA